MREVKRRRAAAALCAVALMSHSAQAEEIDNIIVHGKYLSIDKVNSVKTPTPIIDIPQSLSIITDVQIKNQAFGNIGDVLRYTPGLSISQGEGHRDAIIIRGNDTTADFFLDGLRDDVQYYRPLYNVEQVEVLRGSNALLFGRGGGGGVINRVSKKPEIGEQFVVGTASVDTFGSYHFSGDANYTVSDSIAFRLNAYYEELDNHRDFFEGSPFAINPTASFDLTPDTNLFVSYEYVDDDRVVDRGVPSETVDDAPDVPLEGVDELFFGSPNQNLTTLEAHIVRARLDHTFKDNLRGNITAQYADYDKLYQNLFPVGFDRTTNLVTLDGYLDTTKRQNLIFQGNFVGEFQTGPIGHTILFGAEYGDQQTENARDDNFFPSTADDQAAILVTDPLVIPAFGFTNRVRDRKSDVNFTSVYLQDQVDLFGEMLKLVLGVRWDRFDIDVNDTQNNSAFSRVDSEVTPRLGLIFKPAENISLYGSYSETFVPRSGDQFLTLTLDDANTEPQFFKNSEIGAKWDISPDLALTASAFHLEQESFSSVRTSDPSIIDIIEGATIQGVEVELSGNIKNWWRVTGGFSFLEGEVEDSDSTNNGNETRQTPNRMFSLWNQFRATEQLSFGLGVTHQSAMFVREDNSVEVPGYTRVDAAVYFDVTENIRLQANIENILNTDYFPDAHSNDNISTGAPINGRFTIIGRF